MINAGERRLLEGVRVQGWIRQTGAVLPVVEGATEVEENAGDELHGGWRPRVELELRPTVFPELVCDDGRLRRVMGGRMVALVGRKGLGLRRIGLEGGGGCTRRSWRRKLPLEDWLLRGLLCAVASDCLRIRRGLGHP